MKAIARNLRNVFSQYVLCLLIVFVSLTNGFAIVITSTTSGGNWNTTGTWVGGVVPGATDSVIIAELAEVIVDGNDTCARSVPITTTCG